MNARAVPRGTNGFTLLEVVLALSLLAGMLLLLFAGLRIGLRSWDAGVERGQPFVAMEFVSGRGA